MIHVGFTGTRAGMSAAQRFELAPLLQQRPAFHHGDCVGADAQAHMIARVYLCRIFVHPPESDRFRAFCEGYTDRYSPLPYLRRNHDIVEVCQQLIAAPESDNETLRSGTWATIRYARHYRQRFDGAYRITQLLRNGGTLEL